MVGAAVILMVACCSTGGRKTSSWKPYKKDVFSWQKLDTFVFENPTFKVEYPDCFVPDSSLLVDRNIRFDYSFANCEVFLKCFSYSNDAQMDDSAAVEFFVGYRKLNEDSITMVDNQLTIHDRLEDVLDSINLIQEWSDGRTTVNDFMSSSFLTNTPISTKKLLCL